MNNLLNYAPEIRVGAEKRIKKWSLRAGYRFEQSPYKNGKTIGDLTGISGGFGYSFGYTKIDLAYTHLQRDTQQSMFSQGFTDAPTIKAQNNNIALTVTFDL
jgi:long-subunit fatty acid transport protein